MSNEDKGEKNMKKLIATLLFTFILSSAVAGCTASQGSPEILITPSLSPAPPTTQPKPTSIPSATPLPGAMVLPLDTLGSSVPWLELDPANMPGMQIVGFNTAKAPFNSAIIRRAFAHSIDREVIAKMALKYGYRDAKPATTMTPPQTLGRDLFGIVGANFDPEEAKRLLAEAGYVNTSSFPKVLFLVNASGDFSPGARFNMATAMAEMWKTYLGIEVEVDAIGSFDAYNSRLADNPPDLYWFGWLADYNDPKNFIGEIFNSKGDYQGQYNYGHFENAEFNNLIDRASSGTSARRQALYIEAERLLCETEAAVIPIIHNLYPR
jgi:ABC-type oligopeptide transport system substrate-binding subunit